MTKVHERNWGNNSKGRALYAEGLGSVPQHWSKMSMKDCWEP